MAQIIASRPRDAKRSAFIFGRAFLFGLRFRQSVTRPDDNKTRAVAVNWDADETSELWRSKYGKSFRARSPPVMTLTRIAAYCCLFPGTVLYQPEITDFQ
jgi:hypothetical protein